MMVSGDSIAALIVAIGGSAGITTLLTTIFQRRKYTAEAERVRIENKQLMSQNEQETMTYIKQSLIEMQEMYKKEIAELKESNKALKQEIEDLKASNKADIEELKRSNKAEIDELKNFDQQEINELKETNKALKQEVEQLNNKLSMLMNWVYGDNTRYREWMERKLKECDPDIEFPDRPEPPCVFGNDTKTE